MKIIFIILITFYSLLASAKEKYSFNLNGNFSVNLKALPDGSTFETIYSKGAFVDNLGNYGKYDCNGIREANQNGKLINLNVLCEVLDKDGEQMWFKGKRHTDKIGGIGYYTILDGTGSHKEKVGLVCTYAVTFFEDIILVKVICD